MTVDPKYDFMWITDAQAFEALCTTLAEEEIISIDTETAGWQTGNEKLCLIQIGVPSTRMVALIDTLQVTNLEALRPVLEGDSPKIVAHNAQFEARQFARYDMKMRSVRDTLTLARDLRADLPNHTLRTCCKLLLGIDLDKAQQTSDWSIRPLLPEQIVYARLDAELAWSLYQYLAELESRVNAELELSIPELMAVYSDAVKKRFEITKAISHDLAFLHAREEKLKEAIRAKLVMGEPEYDGPIGYCAVKSIKKTEVNVQKVRTMFPEFAADVIKEHVDRKQFEIVSKERGLPKNTIESVLDTVGFYKRLSIKLKDELGEADESPE